MEQQEDEDPCADKEKQALRKNPTAKKDNVMMEPDENMEWNKPQNLSTPNLREMNEDNDHAHQEENEIQPASYKNMLLGVNGTKNNDSSSSNLEQWDVNDDSEEDMQEDEGEDLDPLCPKVPVTSEERKNLCKPWRKAIIIKLLGRRVGYRFLYARLTKIWNLKSNFELIDLLNDFFFFCGKV